MAPGRSCDQVCARERTTSTAFIATERTEYRFRGANTRSAEAGGPGPACELTLGRRRAVDCPVLLLVEVEPDHGLHLGLASEEPEHPGDPGCCVATAASALATSDSSMGRPGAR